MYNCAIGANNMIQGDDQTQMLQGAINFMGRVFPLLSEDKAFTSRCMWKEQPDFGNQINALKLL